MMYPLRDFSASTLEPYYFGLDQPISNLFSPVYSNGQTELILQVWSLKLEIDFFQFFVEKGTPR